MIFFALVNLALNLIPNFQDVMKLTYVNQEMILRLAIGMGHLNV